MYKKTSRKIHFLLDKAIYNSEREIDLIVRLNIGRISREISTLIKEENAVLTENMVTKILLIIAVGKLKELRNNFLDIIASKDYSYVSRYLAELLDINDSAFSAGIIQTLYKMGTTCYYNKILPFSKTKENHYLYDKAQQYLKRANRK